MDIDIVREALNEAYSGFGHWRRSAFLHEDVVNDHSRLMTENRQFNERISNLETELSHVKQLLLDHNVHTTAGRGGGSEPSNPSTQTAMYMGLSVHWCQHNSMALR